MIVINLSDHDDGPEVKRFRTYLNYLNAYRGCIRAGYSDWGVFLDECLECSKRLQGKKHCKDWVGRYLPIAWNTEYLIHEAPEDNPSPLRIANHWLPVQAYYALYCAAEAVGAVLDGSPPNGHAPALRSVTAYLSNAAPSPWNLCATGPIGRKKKDATAKNLPAGTRIPHNLETGAEPLGMLAKCLLTEHKHRVDDRWESKKINGCFKYQFDPGPTGLLHFLYRLRVKANYRDVDLFLAAVTDLEVMQFTKALRHVTSTGLTLFEVLLMRRLGKRHVIELGSAYLEKNAEAAQLANRLDTYRSVV